MENNLNSKEEPRKIGISKYIPNRGSGPRSTKNRPYSNKKGGPMKSADNRTKWMEDQGLAKKD